MFKKYKNIFLNVKKYRDLRIIYEKIRNKFEFATSVIAKNWAKKNITNLENYCKTLDYN